MILDPTKGIVPPAESPYIKLAQLKELANQGNKILDDKGFFNVRFSVSNFPFYNPFSNRISIYIDGFAPSDRKKDVIDALNEILKEIPDIATNCNFPGIVDNDPKEPGIVRFFGSAS